MLFVAKDINAVHDAIIRRAVASRKGFSDKSCDKLASGMRERTIAADIVTMLGRMACAQLYACTLDGKVKFKDVVVREGKSWKISDHDKMDRYIRQIRNVKLRYNLFQRIKYYKNITCTFTN